MPKQSTSEKIIALLDKEEDVEAVIKDFYAIRVYVGARVEKRQKELEAQSIELQSHKDKIDK